MEFPSWTNIKYYRAEQYRDEHEEDPKNKINNPFIASCFRENCIAVFKQEQGFFVVRQSVCQDCPYRELLK